MSSTEFIAALAQIMLVNVVLSGDNAIVIALAARNLPAHLQKRAVLWGSGGAVVLRILLTAIVVQLLQIPCLQFVGGVLLVWIAVQLLVQQEEEGAEQAAHGSLLAAVKTILIADVVMSLDNTLAIAGVAKGNWLLLMTGLALSIPLVTLGSTLIMKTMARYPILVYLGAALIAWTAGEMMVGDAVAGSYLPSLLHGTPWLALALALAVVGYGWMRNRAATPSTS
jgi:YjbE family integral membrane protein